MAIGPQHLNTAYQLRIDSFEKEIDQILVMQSGNPPTRITIRMPNGMNSLHLQALKPRYLQAGWKDVVYNDDQRDGSSITFVL